MKSLLLSKLLESNMDGTYTVVGSELAASVWGEA